MKELLKKLCQPTDEQRAEALKAELSARNVAYECLEDRAVGVPAKTDQAVVLCAHFDVVPGSFGYNDNGMSLVTVLSVLERLPEFTEVVFTNGEERSSLGARYYGNLNRTRLLGCVNLDVCGFGDAVYCDPMRSGIELPGSKTGRMPMNDGFIFSMQGVPALTLSAGPGDVPFAEGIRQIGQTIHCGPLDNKLEVINFALPDLFGDFLLRALRAFAGRPAKRRK